MRKTLPPLLLVLALGACTGVPVVGPTQLDSYTSADGALFWGGGQLVLIGTASDEPATLELASVAAHNVAQGAMSRTNFLLTPYVPGKYRATNRVVVVIGGGNGATLCTDPPEVGGQFRGGNLHVAAAACNGDRRLSSTRGSVDGVTGPEDPKVARLFSQIGSELFPVRNPTLEDNNREWNF